MKEFKTFKDLKVGDKIYIVGDGTYQEGVIIGISDSWRPIINEICISYSLYVNGNIVNFKDYVLENTNIGLSSNGNYIFIYKDFAIQKIRNLIEKTYNLLSDLKDCLNEATK
jgi:hypothetical protein